MSCKSEYIRGLILVNAGIVGVGTPVSLSGLFSGTVKSFNGISITNDTDRPIKVGWTNDTTGESDYFYVSNGKAFEHQLQVGGITSASLKIYSYNSTLATGNITINLFMH